MRADRIHFPRPSDEGRMTSFDWMPIRYRNVIAVLAGRQNYTPFHASRCETHENSVEINSGGSSRLRVKPMAVYFRTDQARLRKHRELCF
jgi:hypothetical protein